MKTKAETTAELNRAIEEARAKLDELEKKLKQEAAKKDSLPPFFDSSEEYLTISQREDGEWLNTESLMSRLGSSYISLRSEGEFAGKGFFLKGDWKIVTDNQRLQVLTLQKYVDEVSENQETFEKFGRVWKRHDGSFRPPEEVIGKSCYHIIKREMSGQVPYNDVAITIHAGCIWDTVVAYCLA